MTSPITSASDAKLLSERNFMYNPSTVFGKCMNIIGQRANSGYKTAYCKRGRIDPNLSSSDINRLQKMGFRVTPEFESIDEDARIDPKHNSRVCGHNISW